MRAHRLLVVAAVLGCAGGRAVSRTTPPVPRPPSPVPPRSLQFSPAPPPRPPTGRAARHPLAIGKLHRSRRFALSGSGPVGGLARNRRGGTSGRVPPPDSVHKQH